MKRALLTLLALVAAQAPLAAQAETPPATTYNVLLAGGAEDNQIQIWLDPDGRNYVIDSIVPLEVGGTICLHPAETPNEIVCPAPLIAGFEVNAGGGNDTVKIGRKVTIPVTLRGGPGDDHLVGGSGPDKLIGGLGNDKLIGGAGGDVISGGPGDDHLSGGTGNDFITGGPGDDLILTGSGRDVVRNGNGNDTVKNQGGRVVKAR